MSSFNTISAEKLARLIGVPHGPALIDVRAKEDFAADPYNHMVGDEPRTFFIHFWANDDAIKLANGLGAALKTLNVAQK